MAVSTSSQRLTARPPGPPLGRNEAIWGYIFIAAPLIGFIVFAAGPLIASLFLSFTEWDLLTEPEWVGTRNWAQVLALSVNELPRAFNEHGEAMFKCGREDVPESQLSEFQGQLDPRTRQPYVCAPAYARARDVLPRGYDAWFEFPLLGRQYVVGARDAVMWESIFNTVYLLLAIPISLAISLVLAMALNQRIRGKNWFRTIYYLPTILPIAATALIWMWIFNPDYGLLNYALQGLGAPSSISNVNWLQNRETVKPALMIMGVWGGLGYQMVIFLAGLQGIPRHLYEAAEIDGAGAWARFWNVTWPGLTPTTFFLLITSLIGGFQNFVQPYIMTAGGPYNASRTMVMNIWANAFRDLQMGYASAQAWLLGAIIILITILNFTLAKRWVFYES